MVNGKKYRSANSEYFSILIPIITFVASLQHSSFLRLEDNFCYNGELR